MRRKVGPQVIRIDFDHNRSPLLDNGFPDPGRVDVHPDTQHVTRVFHDVGVGMIGGHGLDAPAISREEDDGAEVTGRAGDLLGDDCQEGFDVRDGVAERAGRLGDCGEAAGMTAAQGREVRHAATLGD